MNNGRLFTKYLPWIVIFLLALAVRVVLLSVVFSHNQGQLIPTIHGDDGYYEISQNIIAGHGYSGAMHTPYTLYSF
jgi:hypothetical protein